MKSKSCKVPGEHADMCDEDPRDGWMSVKQWLASNSGSSMGVPPGSARAEGVVAAAQTASNRLGRDRGRGLTPCTLAKERYGTSTPSPDNRPIITAKPALA